MTTAYPIHFNLHDGTHVAVYKSAEDCYEFYLTRLNSERHNFLLRNGQIEESYETRFDEWQKEAVSLFENLKEGKGNNA
jgi:hypothetical protein